LRIDNTQDVREAKGGHVSQELIGAILAMDEDAALQIVKDRLAAGETPESVLEDAKGAMTVLGEKFAAEEVFIPELIMGGEIMKGIAAELKPRITGDQSVGKRGTIVIGTVNGDIHDIGKDVVCMMLEVSGYEVHDLGIDVPVADFVAAVKEHSPQVVGLSGLLTLAFDAMKETVEGLEAAGLRDKVKVMIGGSPVDEQVRIYAAADGWGRDAAAALKLAAEWTGGAA
jgi:trimethylamine corrinoid protein